MANTGNTSSLAFASSSCAPSFEVMTPPGYTKEVIRDSHLGTTNFHTTVPSDLVELDPMTVSFQFDGELASIPITAADAAESVTLTFPVIAPDTNGPTLVGTAFLTNFQPGDLTNDDKIMAEATWQWDGKTEPVWAPGS